MAGSLLDWHGSGDPAKSSDLVKTLVARLYSLAFELCEALFVDVYSFPRVWKAGRSGRRVQLHQGCDVRLDNRESEAL